MEERKDISFRIGPIRPPSEADSLLIQVTRGCTWNRCKFCQLYRHTQFKAYSADSVKADIDNMVILADRINKYKNFDGSWDIDGINLELGMIESYDERQSYYMMANWLVRDGRNVFLQDGNTTVLKGGRLSDVIRYLKQAFPQIERITSYGRAENLSKTSPEEFADLKDAGLDRIHSGFETGSDKVLQMINKGVTQEQEIIAGRNVKAGGIELSIYFMAGVGGHDLTEDNAEGTAYVINQVNPDFVRVRTAAYKPGTGGAGRKVCRRVTSASDRRSRSRGTLPVAFGEKQGALGQAGNRGLRGRDGIQTAQQVVTGRGIGRCGG